MGQQAAVTVHSDSILREIKSKREKMIECANEKGFTNEETIKCSQELDDLIYVYQTCFCSPSEPKTEVKTFIAKLTMVLPKALTGIIQILIVSI